MKQTLIISIIWLSAMVTVHAQEWQSDIETAIKLAKEKQQKVVLVFSGSDWCAPCIKLDKEIWQSDYFKQYAKDHFVMLRADFPRKKDNKLSKEQTEKNKSLAEKYNSQGFFPFVVVINADKKVLGTTGYKKTSPQEYVKILESL